MASSDEPLTSGGLTAPVLSLPKGGGAIRGIGEKFTANQATGTGAIRVPIPLSPGRGGFGPSLALSYDSGAGNGPFGLGWSLGLPSITRKTDKGLPTYEDEVESDVFILSGAEDLVPVASDELRDGHRIRRYRPRIEGLFARIERWTRLEDGDVHWQSISRDNVTTVYGRTPESRVADRGRVFEWLTCEGHDDKGNAVLYEYTAEDDERVDRTRASERDRRRTANRYLKRIRYGNRVSLLVQPDVTRAEWMFEVVFDYDEDHYREVDLDPARPEADQHRFVRASESAWGRWSARPDPFSSYRPGFEVRTHRRCRRVLMFHRFAELGDDPCLVRSLELDYADMDLARPVAIEDELVHQGSTRFCSFIRSITQSGFVQQGDGQTYLKKSLPPLELEYSKARIQDEIRELEPGSAENLPAGVDAATYHLADLDGEGLSGVVSEQAEAWFYKPNLGGGRLGPLQRLPSVPSAPASRQLLDLAGDGRLDVVDLSGPVPGFYERTAAGGWDVFRAFRRWPNLRWDEPDLRFVDLDGDGHADVLLTEDDTFTWHPSLGEDGFDAARRVPAVQEERGARIVAADRTQSIHLADVSGDGLSDLVRIRNGEVCYWPNLGYGRFGAKVTMDGAPWFDRPDQFDQARVRLADIDGSGTTDILYLGHDGVRLYFNQSGNGWSEAHRLRRSPPVDDLSSVLAADLLGNGTACLVWSSALPGDAGRPLRYVDLTGGIKPHLLTRSVNNLGAETHVAYAPSTRFYVQDKLAGRPWVTRLPFPVHVVERIETYDRVSRNRFVTRYAYRHGHFDGEEREFRGFGLVEQRDTEELAAVTGSNVDASSYVPPVLTRTWFHTGAHPHRDRVSGYPGGYYREPGRSDDEARDLLLEDTALPAGLTPEEEREACRALKGAMLRQEVFALDGTPKSAHPYTATEHNFTISVLQRRGDNRHAVFLTHPRESLTHHYERNPADPRVGHALTLEVDAFGNVLKAATVGYGRRRPDEDLLPADRARQAQTLVIYTENRVTNGIDAPLDHRLPLPCESRTYEITGLTLQTDRRRFTFREVLDAGTTASVLEYERATSLGRLQKRVISHARTLYRRDDLAGPLPSGRLESLALPFESYKLAFTPGLVGAVYGERTSDAMLATEGAYVHAEGDGGWWIPSGRAFYSPDPGDAAPQELSHARRHFFLPHRFRDPFHSDEANTESFVAYDAYGLLATETRDAVGNRLTVGERALDDGPPVGHGLDYRVLQPGRLMDANRNRSAVAFDALGMVVATAVMGKPEDDPVPGDRISPAFPADLTQAQIDRFLADPKGPPATELLGDATSRVVYDLTTYPSVVAAILRETHASEAVPRGGLRTQVSFSYADGFGREIQHKLEAEPGDRPRWVGSGWTVFDNKGQPVRKYEPFFADTHRFEFDLRAGVSPVVVYDPVGRMVATVYPDHTWMKVVFDPWRQETWDGSDTVLAGDPRSDPDVGRFFARLAEADYLPSWFDRRAAGALGPQEQAAARKTAVHAATPQVAHADSLGRVVLTVTHNRFAHRDAAAGDPPAEERGHTRVILDIEGNPREVLDALDRVVVRFDYDMLGRRIKQAGIDSGERWMLDDAVGAPLYSWDGRGRRLRTTYDALRRPTGAVLREHDGPDLLVTRTLYGESRPDPEAANLRGQVVERFDQAGVAGSDGYDFTGNLLRSGRRLAREYRATVDWSAPVPLEAQTHRNEIAYDALGRPTEVTAPDGSVLRLTYNPANLLERVDVALRGARAWTPFVTAIDYDARGQRTGIRYGNGVRTTSDYDPLTFHLVRLRTRRDTRGRGGRRLQDLHYTYDAAGNVTHVRDEARQTIYFRNKRVEPSADYTFDALSRLIEASGREHLGQAGAPAIPSSHDDAARIGLPHPGDGLAMARYTERYRYDAVGNLLALQHRGTDAAHPGWTRHYAYAEASALQPDRHGNRLTSTAVGATTETYSTDGDGYDRHGNLLRMPHLQGMEWDFMDLLRSTRRQAVDVADGEPRLGECTWYVYDADGERVRKVTELAPGRVKDERTYLGVLEIFRRHGARPLVRETLHVMAGNRRAALVETRTDGEEPRVPAQLIRYQLGDHRASGVAELDEQARVVSYEEYTPYGSTSYQGVQGRGEAPKRYRFTGKERDEESGLYHHGARWYAPWLGRWTSPDPAGLVDGTNLYAYALGNPVMNVDPSGTSCDPAIESCVDPTEDIVGEALGWQSLQPGMEPAPDDQPTAAPRRWATIRAETGTEAEARKWGELMTLELPVNEFPAVPYEKGGVTIGLYMMAQGLKRGIYTPIKDWVAPEPRFILDSEGRRREWTGHRDNSDALVALVQIGMVFLPTPKAVKVDVLLPEEAGLMAGTGGGSGYLTATPSARMVNQELTMSCGPACGRQLLSEAGVDVAEATVRDAAQFVPEFGTGATQLAKGMTKLHPGATYVGGGTSRGAFEPLMQAGHSWIARIRPSTGPHNVIVDRLEDGIVHLRDPWGLLGPGSGTGIEATMTRKAFLDLWKRGQYEMVHRVK